ncbi:MAG: hypothetical protein ACYC8T_01750 [Myxococcaceae bacterium]
MRKTQGRGFAVLLAVLGLPAPGVAAELGAGKQAAVETVAAASPAEPVEEETGAARLARIRISLRGTDLPLGNILNQIARSARLALVVDKDVRLETKVPSSDLEGSPLDAALAVVLTPAGYSYEVDTERNFLRVFTYASRTFRVAMPVIVQNWSTSISNSGTESAGGAGGVSSAGSLGARIALSARSDTNGLWEEVEKSMGRLLGTEKEGQGAAKEGQVRPSDLGSFSINRVAGFVTVRALPSVMPTVESYFAALNAEMGRTVTIETKVMQVDLFDEKAAGVDWSMAAASLGKLFVGFGSTLAPTVANPVFAGQTAGANPPFIQVSGRAGDAFIRALEQQGTVKVLAQPTLALGNNQPSVIELAEIRAYVYQLTTTVVQGSASAQTTVQTSSLSDGLIMSVMPRVLDNGEISLALGLILQNILEITPFNFPGGSVQLPHTSRRSYSGVIRARLNETLVLGGLITTHKEERHSGVPFLSKIPIIGLLFGTMQHIDRKSELVLTVTPREVRMVSAPPVPVRLDPLTDSE